MWNTRDGAQCVASEFQSHANTVQNNNQLTIFFLSVSQWEMNRRTSHLLIKKCVITLSLNAAVFVLSKIKLVCADQVRRACTRFFYYCGDGFQSAALPCGINSLSGIHVRLYLRQHRTDYTHPNSSCSVLLMKSNSTAAVIHFGRHGRKEQQDYCVTVPANEEESAKSGSPFIKQPLYLSPVIAGPSLHQRVWTLSTQ